MKNKKYHKVGTFPQNNRKIVERSVIDTLTHKYITVQFPGVSHAIRYKKKGILFSSFVLDHKQLESQFYIIKRRRTEHSICKHTAKLSMCKIEEISISCMFCCNNFFIMI